jgi:hypothetical protein
MQHGALASMQHTGIHGSIFTAKHSIQQEFMAKQARHTAEIAPQPQATRPHVSLPRIIARRMLQTADHSALQVYPGSKEPLNCNLET